MVKAWCVWCEMGSKQSSSGYFWIHEDCAHELMDYGDNIKNVKEILGGHHPRNKKEENALLCIQKFIKDHEDFHAKWNKITELLGLDDPDIKKPQKIVSHTNPECDISEENQDMTVMEEK